MATIKGQTEAIDVKYRIKNWSVKRKSDDLSIHCSSSSAQDERN